VNPAESPGLKGGGKTRFDLIVAGNRWESSGSKTFGPIGFARARHSNEREPQRLV